MSAAAMTLDQIRTIGIDALSRSLGPVGMIRFFQQTEMGWGDYTNDRAKWLNDPDLRELFTAIKAGEPGLTEMGTREKEPDSSSFSGTRGSSVEVRKEPQLPRKQ